MVWSHLEHKKSLVVVVVVGGRPNLMLAQVQEFCPGPGPGQDLTGTWPGLDLDLTWDLEWDLDLSFTKFLENFNMKASVD